MFTEVGLMSYAYWFTGFSAMTEVAGFECLSGIADAMQMFTSSGQLEDICAVGFDAAA